MAMPKVKEADRLNSSFNLN